MKGQLLISSGGLYDSNFRHTVVLVVAHDEQGAAGVILNRPLEVTVQEAIPALADLAVGDPLFQGGPVEPDQAVLVVAVADPSLLDLPVFGNVGVLTGDVPAGVGGAVHQARVYLGHAGWGPGQLEAELEAGSWIVERALEGDVFTEDAGSLWRRVLERKGAGYSAMARIPFDPRVN